MKKIVLLVTILAACIAAAGTIAEQSFAAATPIATATKIGDRTFILDASSSPCKWKWCDYSWRVYGKGYSRLGGSTGFDSIVIFTTPSTGVYSFVVTEAEFCAPTSSKSCPGTAQVDVTA